MTFYKSTHRKFQVSQSRQSPTKKSDAYDDFSPYLNSYIKLHLFMAVPRGICRINKILAPYDAEDATFQLRLWFLIKLENLLIV